MLDFNVYHIYPEMFIERFERLFELDKGSSNDESKEIRKSARKIAIYTIQDHHFLRYKPSRIGAACLLLAIDLNKVGVKKLTISATQNLRFATVSSQKIYNNSMDLWTKEI